MNTKKTTPVTTMKGIFDSLDVWREEKGLQHTVGNIAANIGEEIVEYLRAENDEQRVDALCDMFVFSVNALRALGGISNFSICEEMKGDRHRKIDVIAFIANDFSRLIDNRHFNKRRTLQNIVINAKFQIECLGYNFIRAMDETLKEIHSRTGAWNDETGKWEKFKTEEAKALWYTADYTKAKTA